MARCSRGELWQAQEQARTSLVPDENQSATVTKQSKRGVQRAEAEEQEQRVRTFARLCEPPKRLNRLTRLERVSERQCYS